MHIESQQALFRAQTYYWPDEVWNVAAQQWLPYTGKVPKPEGWGDILSDAQAEALKKLSPERGPEGARVSVSNLNTEQGLSLSQLAASTRSTKRSNLLVESGNLIVKLFVSVERATGIRLS